MPNTEPTNPTAPMDCTNEASKPDVEGFLAPPVMNPIPIPYPNVVAPRDVNTGLANGRRTWKPA